MKRLLGALIAALGLATVAAGDAKDEAVKKDRARIAGTWRVVALEINGNKAPAEDVRKLQVVNGADGSWALLSDGKEVVKGTSTIDPTQSPRALDFTPTEGDASGKVYLGVYEVKEATRRMCFAQPGKPRPTAFAAPADSELILVSFEREKAK